MFEPAKRFGVIEKSTGKRFVFIKHSYSSRWLPHHSDSSWSVGIMVHNPFDRETIAECVVIHRKWEYFPLSDKFALHKERIKIED